MTKLNGVPFRKNLVPSSKYNIKCPYSMIPKKITIHNTDNQATAANELSYMISNNNQVSYHIAIDEKEVVQGLPFNRNGWHAGDGRNGYGNRNTIGVEMCRNYDRTRKTTNLKEPLKSQFEKTFNNTIKVVAQVCVDLGIVANKNNIKRHKDWSGKHCPSKILNDNTWDKLVNGIISEYNRLKGKSSSKPTTSTPTKPSKPTTKPSTYKGDSIVDYLNSIGVDSSVANRRKLAKEYSVSNYDLSAAKNLELLNKMRNGKKPSTSSVNEEGASKSTVTTTAFKVGGKVKIKSSAKKYSRSSANIPARYKNKTMTIQQVGKDDVLIKELHSWVKKSDLVGHSASSMPQSKTNNKPTRKKFKVGQKVKIKSTAKTYVTGEVIPSRFKNKTLTIQQVKSDRLLIKELYSWVRISDVQ